MTPDQARKEFEEKFKSVTVEVKQQYERDLPIVWSGGKRTFEETSFALYATKDAAVSEWLETAKSYAEGTHLKWIVVPELLEFQITIADRLGQHRVVNNRFAVKSQFVTDNG